MTNATNETKKLNKGTFGNSPACFYLVDLINNNSRFTKRMKKLHTKHQELNHTLNEIVNAHQEGSLSSSTTQHLIQIKQKECKASIDLLRNYEIKQAMTPTQKEEVTTLINVFENVMMMEFKKLLRELKYYQIVKMKSLQQARTYLKNNPDSEQTVKPFIAKGIAENLHYEAEVHMLTKNPVVIVKSVFKDPINSETLLLKHLSRFRKNP